MAAAALYFLFAIGLVLAFSRWWRPISWRTGFAIVALPVVLFGKALLTDQIIAPLDLHYRNAPLSDHPDAREIVDSGWSRTRYDIAFLMLPWRFAVRDSCLRGEWPLLDPSIAAGDVLASSAQPAPYHPLQLISLLLDFGPDLTFMNLSVLVVLLTGGFFWMRECRIGEAGALIGATGFAFCGFVMQWFGWPIVLTLSMLPMILAAILRLLRSNGERGFFLLTLSCSVMILGGHPQTCVHIMGAGLVLAALVAIRFRQEKGQWPWKGIWAGLLAGALALGVTAIFWLPMLEALGETVEYGLRSSRTAASVGWAQALERLGVVLVPFANGMPHHGHLTAGGWGAYWQAYVDSTLWGAALIPLIDKELRRRPEVWLLVAACFCGALLLVAAPGLIDLLARLPLFEMTINRRLTFVTGLALCTLAALGIDRWLAGTGYAASTAFALALLIIAGAIAWQWPSLIEAGLPSTYLIRWTMVELAPMALALVLVTFGTQVARARALIIVLLLGLLVGQRAVQTDGQNRSFDQRWLAPDEVTVRTLADLVSGGEPQRVIATGARLNPHLATLYGLEDARGSNAVTHRRFFETFAIWAAPRRPNWQIPIVRDLDAPFLSLMNVGYALTERGLRADRWQPILTTGRISVLKNRTVLPRAFIPSRVVFGHNADERLAQMQQATDFRDLAWIEGQDESVETGTRPNGSGTVRARRNGSGLTISARLTSAAWVVISQTAWPGWRAFETVDGEAVERPVATANHAFLALHLEAGTRDINLAYRPRLFSVGLWVSAATLVLLLGLRVGHALQNRHRSNHLSSITDGNLR